MARRARTGGKALPDAGVPLQLVYLSVRPDLIARSLASFRTHYRADRAVVLTGDAFAASMKEVLAAAGFDGHVLTDSQMLSDQARLTDHSERNCRLREALYRSDPVDPYFLSLDDDCILLRELPADHFVSHGRMVARYSHGSLSRWKAAPFGAPTSFDRQQWNTAAILAAAGLPDLGFAAHQAQIVEKESVNAVFAEFLADASGPVDEWALYFNVACFRQPERFVARPATALFWPERFDAWLPEWFADDIYFENRYRELYDKGGGPAAAGLTPESDWRLKRAWVAANYAAHHGQRLLNELSNGGAPEIVLDRDAAGRPTLSGNVAQLFGFPGMILKIGVATGDDARQTLDYAIVEGEAALPECASPAQQAGPRHDLAVRLPAGPGEYSLAVKWIATGETAYLALPLFVLPYPRLA